jgi:hypothetical protein
MSQSKKLINYLNNNNIQFQLLSKNKFIINPKHSYQIQLIPFNKIIYLNDFPYYYLNIKTYNKNFFNII